MTPLMDVMFLVLVFFIYSIFDMSVHKGVKVDLPVAVGALEKGEPIVITIRADNTLQLNGREMSFSEVVSRVGELYAAKMALPVLVAGDRNARLGLGVQLLDELKRAGVEKLSFQVKE